MENIKEMDIPSSKNSKKKISLICEFHSPNEIEFYCSEAKCDKPLLCASCLLKDHPWEHFTLVQPLDQIFKSHENGGNLETDILLSEAYSNLLRKGEGLSNEHEKEISETQKSSSELLSELTQKLDEILIQNEKIDTELMKILEASYKQVQIAIENDEKSLGESSPSLSADHKINNDCPSALTEGELKYMIENKIAEKNTEKTSASNFELNLDYVTILTLLSANVKTFIDEKSLDKISTGLTHLMKTPLKNLHLLAYHTKRCHRKSIKTEGLKVVKSIPTPHKKSIYAVLIIKNYLITCADDGIICVWEYSSWKFLGDLTGHTDRVWTIVKLDDLRFASASSDKKIRIWNLEKRTCEITLCGHRGYVTTLVPMPKGILFSGSHDKTLRIWSVKEEKCFRKIKNDQQGKIMAILIISGEEMAVGSDNNINLYRLKDSLLLSTLKGHTKLVRDLILLEDLQHIISASDDASLKIWNLQDATCLKTLTGHSLSTNKMVLSDRNTVISVGDDAALCIWDLNTGEARVKLENNKKWIIFVDVTEDDCIITAGADLCITFWKAN